VHVLFALETDADRAETWGLLLRLSLRWMTGFVLSELGAAGRPLAVVTVTTFCAGFAAPKEVGAPLCDEYPESLAGTLTGLTDGALRLACLRVSALTALPSLSQSSTNAGVAMIDHPQAGLVA